MARKDLFVWKSFLMSLDLSFHLHVVLVIFVILLHALAFLPSQQFLTLFSSLLDMDNIALVQNKAFFHKKDGKHNVKLQKVAERLLDFKKLSFPLVTFICQHIQAVFSACIIFPLSSALQALSF